MQAILIHGMGRTPLSMLLLAVRLKRAGFTPHLFAHTVTFESWQGCTERLTRFINAKTSESDYIVVTHSLGAVLFRAVSPRLSRLPKACFFIAPPSKACQSALRLSSHGWYRCLTGEIGQRLANQEFMSSLPRPQLPTTIYAGNAGLQGRFSPFGNEPNDGVLMVSESILQNADMLVVPSLHTFIMNNKTIADDIVKKCMELDD